MKIAVISDIHSNCEALISVMKDIENKKVDKIICIGDIIGKGINSNKCINLVKEKCDVVLKGNVDRFFTSDQDYSKIEKEMEIKRIKWNKSLISDENKKYIQNLPYSHEEYISGNLVRFFHAGPNKDDEIVMNFDDFNLKYNQFLPTNNIISDKVADIIVYGHIHKQYMDKLYNKTIINTGSVGNPIELIRNELKDSKVEQLTQAHYLIIEGESSKEISSISFQFIKVPYDIKKELENNKDNIEYNAYNNELNKGIYRDLENIRKYYNSKGIDMDKF